MIDRRTIKFFQELPRLEQSNNNFFEEDFDIPLDHVNALYELAKTITIPPRDMPGYSWYYDSYSSGLNSIDLYNPGQPVHDHQHRIFKKDVSSSSDPMAYRYNDSTNSNAIQVPWDSKYKLFEDIANIVGRKWRWCQLIKTDPLGYWGVHRNNHFLKDTDYRLTWIPLNYVKNRFVGGEDVGYFEPKLGKSYVLHGELYNYGGINLGTEPMYNISAVLVNS